VERFIDCRPFIFSSISNLPRQVVGRQIIQNTGNKTMKIRAVVILIGLAISFALPIFAQERDDVKPFPFTPIPAGPQLVHRLISRRHTVGFKRVWMQGASEECIRCDT
jgi:hypothetical protein